MRSPNKKILFAIIMVLPFLGFGQNDQKKKKVNWLTFEQAVELNKKVPKKIIIDVYTDWCGWCKRMDKATYSDSSIIEQLEKDYYVVKFNAEQKDSVKFNDKVFRFNKQYKSHELAVSLLNGRMSYPSTVFLDEDMNLLTVVPGYLEPKDISPILKYFGESIYKSQTWEEYQKTGSQ